MALSNGTLLKERYRIDSVLGQGGMGAVYQATDALFGIPVAVKENLFLSEEYTRQFEQEARILASLRHRSLPRVIDFYRIPGQGQYLIMDYIDGEDLRDLIKRWGKLSEKDVVLVGYHICEALQYLHQSIPPVIHRDIKPGNIKITKNQEVFLVDFGLAKLANTPQQVTITGARAMTPGYSPPEQYGTARTDGRSDIYSLGATLYNALTGAVPEDALDRITNKALLTPILEHRDSTEPSLVNVIERAMEIDADDRYQTALEFQEGLLTAAKMESLSIDARLLSRFDSVQEDSSLENGAFSDRKKSERNGRFVTPSKKRKRYLRSPHIMIWSILLLIVLTGLFSLNPNLARRIRALRELMPSALNASTQMTATIDAIEPTATAVILTPERTATPNTTAGQESITLTPTDQKADEDLASTKTPVILTKMVEATAAEAVSPPSLADDHPIVFASNREGTLQLWVMREDGTDQIRLTDMPSGACQPSWAPDGTKIVFISPCRKVQDVYNDSILYVYDFDDKSIVPLIALPDDEFKIGNYEPAWSPDGASVAYTSIHTGISHIFIYVIDTQEIREISNSGLEDRQPSWHPDGDLLVFSRNRVNWILWEISQDGNNLRQVSVSGNVSNGQPTWSPDGKYILFSQSDESKVPWLVKLYTGNFGSTLESKIYAERADFFVPVLGPKFSPDGTKIIFESWPDGNNRDIFMMDLDGTNLTRLTTNPNYDIDPDWHRGKGEIE